MEIVIAIIGGFIGGFMNSVASSGTAVTLPLLLLMGLSPPVANATNRVPVFLGLLISTFTFLRAGLLQWHLAIKIVIPCSLGAIFGAIIADRVPDGIIKVLIVIAVVMALLLLLSNFKKTFDRVISGLPRYRWQEAIYLFLAGLWIGLIVLDGGTYLLLILMISMQLPLLKANAYKNLASLFTSGLSLLVMGFDGKVDWSLGLIMSVGSVAGGYIGAKFSMHSLAKVWTYRLLVAIICFELIKIILRDWLHIYLLK